MVKAAAYLRVSTEAQAGAGAFGLDAQRQAVNEYAAREGFEVVAWYIDKGVSGATIDRPGLGDLLSASAGAFDVILVAKIDRLARDLMAQLWLEKEMLRRGHELISAGEPFRGQDSASVLFRQVVGAFAQFEKARIAERMSGGRKAKARAGGYAGGGAPLGYTSRRGSGVLAVDVDGAEAVNTVFALRKKHQRWSLRRLAEALNAAGVTTARGVKWHASQVKRILDRADFYGGVYQYAGESGEGAHKAITTG